MKESLMDVICCPLDKADLDLDIDERDDEEILGDAHVYGMRRDLPDRGRDPESPPAGHARRGDGVGRINISFRTASFFSECVNPCVSTLSVELNGDAVHSIRAPDRFETTGPFAVALENEGRSTHVHLHFDDDLDRVVSVAETNHFVDDERPPNTSTSPSRTWRSRSVES